MNYGSKWAPSSCLMPSWRQVEGLAKKPPKKLTIQPPTFPKSWATSTAATRNLAWKSNILIGGNHEKGNLSIWNFYYRKHMNLDHEETISFNCQLLRKVLAKGSFTESSDRCDPKFIMKKHLIHTQGERKIAVEVTKTRKYLKFCST